MTSAPHVTTDVSKAAEVLLAGGIIGLPTETVYGLAALALNEKAVQKVFDVKGRPRSHPLIVHLGDVGEIGRWAHMNDHAMKLAEVLWPGPMTLLLPKTDLVPMSVTGGRDTVAIRIPAHQMARDVLNLVNTGVVAPSANHFGKVSPTTADHVIDDLGVDVDLVLDGGPCAVGLESTIVECIGRNVQILRPGAVTADDVMRIINLPLADGDDESRAPGMMISHYAPAARIMLVHSVDEAGEAHRQIHERGVTSRLLWYPDPDRYALNLYDDLRRADLAGIQMVIAVMPTGHGIAEAIRDRLRKAAAGR